MRLVGRRDKGEELETRSVDLRARRERFECDLADSCRMPVFAIIVIVAAVVVGCRSDVKSADGGNFRIIRDNSHPPID